MARIFTEGFEFGDTLSLEQPHQCVAVSNLVKTGNYSGKLVNNSDSLYKSIDGELELYCRVKFSTSDTASIDVESTLGNNDLISVQYNGGGNITAKVNGATVATGTYAVSTWTWYTTEIYFKIDDSAGRIVVKINDITDIDYTGDTDPTSSSVINAFTITNLSGDTYLDDIGINDTNGSVDNSWCGDGKVLLYRPNSTGSTTMLMGSDENQTNNYELVDDIPSDGDTSFVYSGSPGYYDLYGLQDTNLPVNSVIKRIWVESRAKDPELGYLNSVVQTASGSYTSASVQLSSSYSGQKYQQYETNPETGKAWTLDEIDNLQIGIRIAE